MYATLTFSTIVVYCYTTYNTVILLILILLCMLAFRSGVRWHILALPTTSMTRMPGNTIPTTNGCALCSSFR